MNREAAKDMFRKDKDSYGKPKAIMKKIDKIYDEFETEIEYSIIPITYKDRDYNEYVNALNECGEDGWIVGAMIWTYHDSPMVGLTTHDFICHRNKR